MSPISSEETSPPTSPVPTHQITEAEAIAAAEAAAGDKNDISETVISECV